MEDNIFMIMKKEAEYKEYITTHINNVKKAWEMMRESKGCMNIIKKSIDNYIIPNSILSLDGFIYAEDLFIKTHDHSKFSLEEWDAYRRHFYPISDKEKEESKEDFEKAWVHHYTVNTHHWNHWYKNKKNVNAMDLISVVELCCDWIAMNMVFKGTAIDFYNNRVVNCKDPNEQIYLGDKQSKIIYDILTEFYKSYPKEEE